MIPPFEQWLAGVLPAKNAPDYSRVLSARSGVRVRKPGYDRDGRRSARRRFWAKWRLFKRHEAKAIAALRREHARLVELHGAAPPPPVKVGKKPTLWWRIKRLFW